MSGITDAVGKRRTAFYEETVTVWTSDGTTTDRVTPLKKALSEIPDNAFIVSITETEVYGFSKAYDITFRWTA